MLPPLPRSCMAAITYFRPNHTPRTFTAITRSNGLDVAVHDRIGAALDAGVG